LQLILGFEFQAREPGNMTEPFTTRQVKPFAYLSLKELRANVITDLGFPADRFKPLRENQIFSSEKVE
jgi:hypothetical protein